MDSNFTKNQEIELTITDLGSDGEGVGKAAGAASFIFFVKGALPGERVRASVMRVKKQYGYARLLEVLTPSPLRVKPPCPVYGRCGGCQLMHLGYAGQLKYKERKVREALIRIGGVEAAQLNQVMEPILAYPEDGQLRYRNKAQYPFGMDREGQTVYGFYAGRTHSIIPHTDCLLGTRQDAAILQSIAAWMERYGIPAYDESRAEGIVRHVLIRRGHHSGEVMVCIVGNAPRLPEAEALCERIRTYSGVCSICYSVNMAQTNVILGEEIQVLWGKGEICDEIRIPLPSGTEADQVRPETAPDGVDARDDGGTVSALRFHISPLSFYQVNPVQMERLYATALAYAGLTGNEVVWDLYCGIGTITLFLARHARQVYGVEVVPQAIADARRNAEENGITNVSFLCDAAESLIPEDVSPEAHVGAAHTRDEASDALTQGSAKTGLLPPDVIVVDPPRKGCDTVCLQTMVRLAPARIVYVSCDPATLARDVKYLREHGYALQRVRPCDMFPHTRHCETVCLLSNRKRKPDSYVKVSLDMEDYYKIKDEQKAKKEAE